MTPVVSLPDPELIETEACAWIAQVDAGDMSEGDLAALKEWISRSPQHRRAFEKMAARFLELRDPLQGMERQPQVTRGRVFGRFSWRPWVAACAAVVIAGFVLFAFMGGVPSVRPPVGQPGHEQVFHSASYQSRLGEQKTVTLEDGSVIVLNTNTRIEVENTPRERRVHLVYGEAIFDVAKDEKRPFKVYTDRGTVRAIGTVFSVRVRRSDVAVLVEEGIVELAPHEHDAEQAEVVNLPATATRVASGKYATFNEKERIVTAVDMKTMDKKLSWRDGILVFEVDPLSHVVEEVSRYTDVKIIISDPKILDIPVGGMFRTGETKALLDALEKGFGLRVHRVQDDLIYLSKGV